MNPSPDDTRTELEVDQELMQRARALHEHACEHIDAATRAKLATVRRAALAAKDHRPRRVIWLPAAGAAAATCALAIGLVWFKPRPGSPAAAQVRAAETADAELPLDADARQLDLYRNLDFYQWLAQQPQTSPRTHRGGE